MCPQCRRPWFDFWVGKIRWRRDRLPTPAFLGFPCDSAGKEYSCNVGDLGLIRGLGRSPGEGNGTHSIILAWRIHRQRSLESYSPWVSKTEPLLFSRSLYSQGNSSVVGPTSFIRITFHLIWKWTQRWRGRMSFLLTGMLIFNGSWHSMGKVVPSPSWMLRVFLY